MSNLVNKEYPLVINSYPCINNWFYAPSIPLRESRYEYLLGHVIDVKQSHLLEIIINTSQGAFRMIAALNNIFPCCYNNCISDHNSFATGDNMAFEYLVDNVKGQNCIVKIHGYTKSGIPFIELLIPKDEYIEEFIKYFPQNELDTQLTNFPQITNNDNSKMVHIGLSRSLFINVGNHILNTLVDPEHRLIYHNKGRMVNKKSLFNRVWKKKDVFEDEQDKQE